MKSGEEIADELGLKRTIFGDHDGLPKVFILARDVYKLLEGAVEVTGFTDDDGDMTYGDLAADEDTHSALLINIKPLKPKTVEFETHVNYSNGFTMIGNHNDEFKQFRGKKVKVTVSEVKE